MRPEPLRPLIMALGVAMAPLVFKLPWWAILWCVVLWAGVLIRTSRGGGGASQPLRVVLILMGVGLVMLSAGMRLDGGDFVTLLAVMAGVKPLEVNHRRDSMVTVFLAYFLVITSLFVFENLTMVLYLFVSVWFTTAVLIHVNDPLGAFGLQLKLSARLVLMATPLMMLQFVAFPRLSAGLVGAPWSGQSRAGFSDVVRMGDVALLVVDDAPAFSVFFDDALPPVDQRYWRGIVFQRFDGNVWQAERQLELRRETIEGATLVSYTVILEPHGHPHLFVLDLPVRATPLATIMADHTLRARRPVFQRLTYTAASLIDYRQAHSNHPGAHYLELPPDLNPLTIALGRQLAQTHAEPAAVIRHGLDFFRDNGFAYTLRPDPVGQDAVDDFLFTSRNGFCEHFASAFTVLMRASGLPTRMVGGYQGGRWNAWGNFLTVRQADAHVWCEVWLEGRGWVRVDPTFAVAPDRINSGIDTLFEALPWLSARTPGHGLSGWIERIRQTWEAINIRWNMWFMGFSVEDQTALLKTLGHQGWWLLVVGLPLLIVTAVLFLRRRRSQQLSATIEDQALMLYKRFLKKMSRVGPVKPPYQGPRDYAQTVLRHHPALEKEVAGILDHYLALRYGRRASMYTLKALRRQVRRFNPRKIVKKR